MNQGEQSTQRYCRNCYYPLPPSATYCPDCSQKYTTGRISIIQLLKQLISNLFNLDSKLFMTLGALFIPARLTINYFKGQHQRYASPFRVFLVTTLLFVTILSLFINRQDLDEQMSSFDNAATIAQRDVYIQEMDSLGQEIRQEFSGTEVDQALDSLSKRMGAEAINSVTSYFNTIKFSSLLRDSVEEIKLGPRDLALPMEEIYKKYEITYLIDKIAVRQLIKFIKSEGLSTFVQFLIGNIIWLMLLFLPTMAFVLHLLYIRRSYYYVEHLVFLLHYHSFIFLIAGLYFGWGIFFEKNPLFLVLPIIVYIYVAMYKNYQQSWLKTFLKYCIFNSVYFVLYIIFFSLISILSFFLF